MSLQTVWSLADITMGLMTLCNLVAIALLGGRALLLLKDYTNQLKNGKDPIFKKQNIHVLTILFSIISQQLKIVNKWIHQINEGM